MSEDDAMTVWLDHLNGGRVQYRQAAGLFTRSLEAGEDGPVIVMLHGTWGHAETYVRNVVPLASLGYRVHSIDMIGHGFTGRRDGCAYLMEDFVEHLLGYLDALETASAHIVGESLGGWVAMRAALTAPERVRTVVNVVGGGLRPVPPTEAELAGWATLEQRSNDIIADPSFENWQSRMRWLVHDPLSMPDEMVSIRAAINVPESNRAASQAMFASVARMLRQEQPGALGRADIAAVPVPVYYLWTDHNPTTPTSVAREACGLTRDATLDVMAECGHWPQYERPDEFNKLVGEFLQAHQ
jgi:2-hydroxy-6-oxonona-2,4-dienedioate hydrolase/2-hydroxy-6-oxo-6-(2'-carboxyphenyl)-hexa-2,4-dienoate hydrolase